MDIKQFKNEDIHKFTDSEGYPFFFSFAMISTCAPLFDELHDNYAVEKLLAKAKVLTKADLTDSETCALCVYFKTRAQGERFIKRLNKYLLKWAKRIQNAKGMED
jgi:hypothetical protein